MTMRWPYRYGICSSRICRLTVPTSLLQDLGRIPIANRLRKDGKGEDFLRFAEENGTDFRKAEKAFCGMTAEEVTYRMLLRWEISGYIADAVRDSVSLDAETESVSNILYLARLCMDLRHRIQDIASCAGSAGTGTLPAGNDRKD